MIRTVTKSRAVLSSNASLCRCQWQHRKNMIHTATKSQPALWPLGILMQYTGAGIETSGEIRPKATVLLM